MTEDAGGQITRFKKEAVSTRNGRVDTVSLPNGVLVDRDYKGVHLASIEARLGGAPIASFAYKTMSGGHQKELVETIGGAQLYGE